MEPGSGWAGDWGGRLYSQKQPPPLLPLLLVHPFTPSVSDLIELFADMFVPQFQLLHLDTSVMPAGVLSIRLFLQVSNLPTQTVNYVITFWSVCAKSISVQNYQWWDWRRHRDSVSTDSEELLSQQFRRHCWAVYSRLHILITPSDCWFLSLDWVVCMFIHIYMKKTCG